MSNVPSYIDSVKITFEYDVPDKFCHQTNELGKKGTFTYNHDDVYSEFQEKFETMECFQKYGNYTNANVVPKFCRHLSK